MADKIVPERCPSCQCTTKYERVAGDDNCKFCGANLFSGAGKFQLTPEPAGARKARA